jgi:hypothetical protein
VGKRVEEVQKQEGTAVSPTPLTRPKDKFCRNFVWMGVLGVLLLFGIGRYTDYLETVIGLLGLGGIFAWVAFLFNVISKTRREAMQEAFENLLKHRNTTIFLWIATAVVAALAANITCITIDSGRDTIDRHVEIRRFGCDRTWHTANLSPDAERRFLVIPSLWGHEYSIDTEGLPTLRRTIRPLVRARVRIPQDPRRRCVVLIRPDKGISDSAADITRARSLVIKRIGQSASADPNENEATVNPYKGNTVWVGTRRKLDIPRSWKERWRLEMSANSPTDSAMLMRWLDPTLAPGIYELEPGQMIEISVIDTQPNPPELVRKWGPFEVSPCRSEEDFPQIIHIGK